MPENKIQFNGENLSEVKTFLGEKLITTHDTGPDAKIKFTHAGNYPVVADIWDVFSKGQDGDIYLESRMTEQG